MKNSTKTHYFELYRPAKNETVQRFFWKFYAACLFPTVYIMKINTLIWILFLKIRCFPNCTWFLAILIQQSY